MTWWDNKVISWSLTNGYWWITKHLLMSSLILTNCHALFCDDISPCRLSDCASRFLLCRTRWWTTRGLVFARCEGCEDMKLNGKFIGKVWMDPEISESDDWEVESGSIGVNSNHHFLKFQWAPINIFQKVTWLIYVNSNLVLDQDQMGWPNGRHWDFW